MTHTPVHHGGNNNGKDILKRLLAIAGALFGLQFFFFQEGGPVSFVLQAFIFMAFLTAVFIEPKHIKKQIPVFIGGYAVFVLLSWMMMTRAYWLIQSLSGVLVVIHLTYFAYLLAHHSAFIHSISELVSVPFRMISAYMRHWFQSLTQLVSGKFVPEKTHLFHITGAIRTAVFGVVISIPVLAILVYLLTSADPIYASFIKGWFTQPFINTLSTFGERLIPTVFVFLLLLPFLTFQIQNRSQPPQHLFAKFRFVNEVTIMMILVAVVLASFILIQWPYIFTQVATEADLSDFGIETYSEYVRRGFGELLRVSVFVYGLVWIGLITYRNKKKDAKTILPIIQMIVLGILLVFIFSIFRRVWLYQEFHGWTLIRIYGSIFLAWLMLITGTLALRHYYLKRWIMVEVLITVCVIGFIGLFNAERFIVRNHPPTVNDQVDYVYLSRMSPDGYEGWEESVAHANSVLLEKQYTEDRVITEYERRQIAYSGFITVQMLQNYNSLIVIYGSDKDREEYTRVVLSELVSDKEKQIQDAKAFYKSETTETNKRAITNIETRYKDLIILQQLFENNPEMFNTDLFIRNVSVDGRPHRSKPYMVSKRPELYGFTLKENHELYTSFFDKGLGIPDEKKLKERYLQESEDRSYDRFLQWNASEAKAFEKMKEDGMFSDLLTMRSQYRVLADQIYQQPREERDISVDISLNAPLLYPVW